MAQVIRVLEFGRGRIGTCSLEVVRDTGLVFADTGDPLRVTVGVLRRPPARDLRTATLFRPLLGEGDARGRREILMLRRGGMG